MKVMAFNGSPRKKKWNTVTLLKHVLKGAASVGAKTELIQLYDLNYSGCISCFSCKKINRKKDGICAVQCVFWTKPATDSDRKRPLIPIDSGHRFRRKAATPS